MTTIELKGKLLHKISKIDDPDFFEALKIFIDVKLGHKVYQTSKAQKLVVEEGLNQFKNGRVFQILNLTEKWKIGYTKNNLVTQIRN